MEFQFQRLNLSLKCQEVIRLRSAKLEIHNNQEKQTNKQTAELEIHNQEKQTNSRL